MTNAASLASRLRSMPAEDLVGLIVRRRVSANARVDDLFDLAELLRTPDSIDRALEDLPRESIEALGAGTADERGIRLGLASADGVDEAVVSRIADRGLVQTGGSGRLPETPHVPDERGRDRTGAGPTEPAAEQQAAERAFATMSTLAELLRAVDEGLVRELAKGGIGTPLARGLGEIAGSTADVVVRLLGIAVRAGFADDDQTRWRLAGAGRTWLAADWPERWVTLVHAWRIALRVPVAEVLAEARADWTALDDIAEEAFPAGGARLRADLAEAAADAALLGLIVGPHPTDAGRTLLDAGGDGSASDVVALETATARLPQTVPTVYLQADLTVIAPGPLAPSDDAALRRVARLEAPGLAARYRISEDSVRRAFRAGLTRDEILADLERLSATGIPQPLRYLVDQVAARDGAVVVDVGPGGFGAELRGSPTQLDLIGVDAELRHLGWRRVDVETLVTRSPLALVSARLDEQRYETVLAAAARPVARPEPPDRRSRADDAVSRAQALVERLRAAAEDDGRPPEQEWIGRQVDLAIREKSPITIVVRMPDGSERKFTIVPTALAGGRIRGREVGADVERTLPLALVVRIDAD